MKILLAIESSAASEVALNEVAVRPWPPATTVKVLGVTDPSYFLDVPQLVETVTQRTEELAQRAAGCLGASGIEASSLVLSGDPKAVIVDRAGPMNADFRCNRRSWISRRHAVSSRQRGESYPAILPMLGRGGSV